MVVGNSFFGGDPLQDLREVGEKAIDSVNKLGASDAGDLVLGIGEIIQELRDKPELYQDKLDHLEGLFREFVYGEGYELRNNRVPEEKDDDDDDMFSGFGAMSGMITHVPLSGSLPIVASGSFGSYGISSSPIKAPVDDDDEEEEDVASVFADFARPLQEALIPKPVAVPPEPKKFKKRWWNKRI